MSATAKKYLGKGKRRDSKRGRSNNNGRSADNHGRNTDRYSDDVLSATESDLKYKRGEKVVSSKEVKERKLKNDPNWYFTDPILAEQASQLSFQQFLGSDYSKINDYTMPTVMALLFNPSPGDTLWGASAGIQAQTAGINLSCRALFNELSMNSGRNMAYQPCDLGIMILALGELYSMVSYVKRAFGVAQTFNTRNRTFPVNIIRMMGLDAQDFMANLADYRMRFNTLLAAVNQLPMLTNVGYLQKCATLYDSIFLDQESPMAQIYLPLPATTWIIDEASVPTGTILKTVEVVQDANTFAHRRTFGWFMYNILEPMVKALMDSSTLNLIYADLLNLAGKKNLSFMAFTPVDESYIVLPEYNIGFLEQVHNAVSVGLANYPTYDAVNYFTPFNDVYSDAGTNELLYNPGFSFQAISSGKYTASDKLIDSIDAMPDKVRRIEMTRMVACFTNNNPTIGGVNYNHFVLLPDHYLTRALIYANDPDTVVEQIFTVADGSVGYPSLATIEALAKFDWAPNIHIIDSTDITGHNIQHVYGDTNFYTLVEPRYFERLNNLVSMGLFQIR